jgi:ubiquinone/menaquinone biosynthesis C-methylase UbiE
MNTASKNTTSLKERIKQNENNQTFNLNTWAFSKIFTTIEPINILEMCCGTGKQTEYLCKHFSNSHITAIDISSDSICSIEAASFFDSSKISTKVISMDEFFDTNLKKYDVVFISYGLYYSTNIDKLITMIVESLNPNGKFIVLGSYGNSNKTLFNLIEESGVKINEFVLYSCTNFMYDKVVYPGITHFKDIQINTIINTIRWNSVEDVISYWKNSTFFDETKKIIVEYNLQKHFEINNTFNVDKNIMLFQGIKS